MEAFSPSAEGAASRGRDEDETFGAAPLAPTSLFGPLRNHGNEGRAAAQEPALSLLAFASSVFASSRDDDDDDFATAVSSPLLPIFTSLRNDIDMAGAEGAAPERAPSLLSVPFVDLSTSLGDDSVAGEVSPTLLPLFALLRDDEDNEAVALALSHLSIALLEFSATLRDDNDEALVLATASTCSRGNSVSFSLILPSSSIRWSRSLRTFTSSKSNRASLSYSRAISHHLPKV
mmetsp:Transcript_30247/g.90050  ORF Transcript_30247/g.90050 Transcript_30247/m.90050 type:complete len:233 (+) Transcript_30247:1802-2500(+)